MFSVYEAFIYVNCTWEKNEKALTVPACARHLCDPGQRLPRSDSVFTMANWRRPQRPCCYSDQMRWHPTYHSTSEVGAHTVPGTWREQGHPRQQPTWVEGRQHTGEVANVKGPPGSGPPVLIQKPVLYKCQASGLENETGFLLHRDYTRMFPSPLAPQKSLLSIIYSFSFPHFMPSCQGSLRAPGSSPARVHGRSSISTLYPFASGQQAASRPEPLFTGIFTMTLTSGLHGPQLPGSVARDSWSTQTPTCFGLPGVSPSVRLISLSAWERRREGPPSEPSTAGRVVGGPVWGMAITLTQSTRDICAHGAHFQSDPSLQLRRSL